jgi:hypothetical protein
LSFGVTRRVSGNEWIPISDADMGRFRRHAPAALARRGAGFAGEELGRVASLLLTGLIPIIGLLVFDWSASEMLVFLLIGSWLGIGCDLAKVLLLPAEVRRRGELYYNDWQVWVVVHALRRGLDQAAKSHLQAKYEPAKGVLIDLVCGGLGTALICVALVEAGFDFRGELWENRWVLKSAALLAIYEVAKTVWEIVRHKRGGESAGEVRVAVGLRGLALFLLLPIVVMMIDALGENGAAARGVMLAVHAAILVFAGFSVAGFFWMQADTNWLRQYLRDPEAWHRKGRVGEWTWCGPAP